MHLAGKLVLITGASSGIGRATAEAAASRGARVALLARSEQQLSAVATGIATAGGGARPFVVDLTDADAVGRTADMILSEIGVPDVIVNNAGVGRWLSIVDTPPAEAAAMVAVPYLAAFYTTRAFLPAMLRRRSGHIVTVASPAAFMAWPNAAGYTAARFALRGFDAALAAETRGTGIDVSLVVLGTVESPYWEHNPCSREHLPKPLPLLMPTLSVHQAANAILEAIEHRRRRVVRPWIFNPLFRLMGA
jgi:short-subunit dehydrogenase